MSATAFLDDLPDYGQELLCEAEIHRRDLQLRLRQDMRKTERDEDDM